MTDPGGGGEPPESASQRGARIARAMVRSCRAIRPYRRHGVRPPGRSHRRRPGHPGAVLGPRKTGDVVVRDVPRRLSWWAPDRWRGALIGAGTDWQACCNDAWWLAPAERRDLGADAAGDARDRDSVRATPTSENQLEPWTGPHGNSDVRAIHIGMGPPRTRAALYHLFDTSAPDYTLVDHVMNAGICGGLDPGIDVGTLINPEFIVDHNSGTEYRHDPPGDVPLAGKLLTMQTATLDASANRRFLDEGFLAVDMESAAVAEVCEAQGCAWSIYRCVGDRYFDGLLDERIIAATNQDGSGNMAEIQRLLQAEPELAVKLDRLRRETLNAARLAAEAAVAGCLALDS